MKDNIDERCIRIAVYIRDEHATVRKAARRFGVSKSTVYTDVTTRLRYADRRLYEEVKPILEQNKAERHLRGGEATRRKYEHLQEARGRLT